MTPADKAAVSAKLTTASELIVSIADIIDQNGDTEAGCAVRRLLLDLMCEATAAALRWKPGRPS